MITASMTSGEMRRVRNLDEARIYEFHRYESTYFL